MKIPDNIDGVAVVFAPNVVNDVVARVIEGMKHCIRPDIATGHTVEKIYVSSAKRKSSGTSNHNVGRAVDISRISGIKMKLGFNSDPTVTAVVKAIQVAFESFPEKRENFGPAFKKKLGQPFQSLSCTLLEERTEHETSEG